MNLLLRADCVRDACVAVMVIDCMSSRISSIHVSALNTWSHAHWPQLAVYMSRLCRFNGKRLARVEGMLQHQADTSQMNQFIQVQTAYRTTCI